jgi:hypothetical protein
MRRLRSRLIVGLVAAIVLIGPAWWAIRAQNPTRPAGAREPSVSKAQAGGAGMGQPSPGQGHRRSVQEAMLQPIPLPFARETSLEDVIKYLRRTLGAPVVLDMGAMNRLELSPQDTVQLELEGVRLKTGLKLLLGQLDLTYRVVAEDNLLIITDAQGSDNPLDHVLSELRSLHRDIHALQDAVDELRELEDPGSGDEPGRSMRIDVRRAPMPPAAARSRRYSNRDR